MQRCEIKKFELNASKNPASCSLHFHPTKQRFPYQELDIAREKLSTSDNIRAARYVEFAAFKAQHDENVQKLGTLRLVRNRNTAD